MKKRIISIIIGCIFAFSTAVTAAEVGQTTDNVLAPLSSVYSIDQLFQDINAKLTFDSEEEAGLILGLAQERLAEAGQMTEAEKAEFVQSLIDDYVSTLEQVQTGVLDNNLEAEPSVENLEETSETEAEEIAPEEVVDGTEGATEGELEATLEEKVEKVNFTANVVKGIDIETVKSLREKGLGFGQIAQAAILAEMSEKTIEEIADLLTGEEVGFGSVAKQLGINPSEIKGKVESSKSTKSRSSEELKLDDAKIDEVIKKMREIREEIKERNQAIEDKKISEDKQTREEEKLSENSSVKEDRQIKEVKSEKEEKQIKEEKEIKEDKGIREEKEVKAEKEDNEGSRGRGKN